MKNKTTKLLSDKVLHKTIIIRSCPFCGCKPKLSKRQTDFSLTSSFEVDISCRSNKCKVHPSLSGYNRFAHSKEEKQVVVEEVINN